MAKKQNENKINIDGSEYVLSDLSTKAKAHITNIQFVDAKLQQLNNEWAISDTARIGYENALKAEMAKAKKAK